MKTKRILILMLALLGAQKSLAGESVEPSGDASGLVGAGALSAIAAPVLVSVGVVSLVGAGVEGIGELSGAALDSAFSEACTVNCVTVNTGKGKKSIPFVVREDYAQMNERI